MCRNSLRNFLGLWLILLTTIALAQAQDSTSNHQREDKASAKVEINIRNFGQMDDRFYRGAQPDKNDYRDLAAIGIKTIIDLRDDPKEYSKAEAEAAGLTYVHIPMIAKKYPTEEATKKFLEVTSNPGTGKFFVHCAGGRHRTGAMGAVYRFEFYNWNFAQVYQEMKKFDFYTAWGHGAFKDFVKDYERKHNARAVSGTPAQDNPPSQEKK